MLKRAIGCLYGQLIGDAFGCRYEFYDAKQTVTMIQNDSDSSGFVPILGGGPFHLSPGQVTDDSEMALSLAASICRLKCFDAADVAAAYVEWSRCSPPDIGIATAAALAVEEFPDKASVLTLKPKEKLIILQRVLENVKKHNSQSRSNGCLMRISPLAIALSKLPLEKAKIMLEADCHLTHCDEVCVDAVVVYSSAVSDLINGHSPKEAYSHAVKVSETGVVKDLLECAQDRATPVKVRGHFVNGDTSAMGYVGVALQSAFYELLHASDFVNGLVSAVRRGGDTDTNGAIVAALLGARFGIEEIPDKWVHTIRTAKPRFNNLSLSYDVESIAQQLLTISEIL